MSRRHTVGVVFTTKIMSDQNLNIIRVVFNISCHECQQNSLQPSRKCTTEPLHNDRESLEQSCDHLVFSMAHARKLSSGPPRQGRQARFGPCLDFGFQYALIRNNWSKKIWGRIMGSNSPWHPCSLSFSLVCVTLRSVFIYLHLHRIGN